MLSRKLIHASSSTSHSLVNTASSEAFSCPEGRKNAVPPKPSKPSTVDRDRNTSSSSRTKTPAADCTKPASASVYSA